VWKMPPTPALLALSEISEPSLRSGWISRPTSPANPASRQASITPPLLRERERTLDAVLANKSVTSLLA